MESVGTAPLINEYKLSYFSRRFPQTLLGGPKLKLGFQTPFYVKLNQLLLFVFPFMTGFSLTALASYSLDKYITAYIHGGIIFMFVLIVQIIYLLLKRHYSDRYQVNSIPHNILGEDDEVEFLSCCGFETLEFIIQKKRFLINYLLHPAISGVLNGVLFLYLLPSQIESMGIKLTQAESYAYLYSVFGWLTICIGQYPLTAQSPPEPAQFRTTDALELNPLYRPFYMACCGIVGLVAKFSNWYPLHVADFVLHIIFPCLPLLWALGILPPLDALFPWAGEQCLVYIFGGSPMANDIRLLVSLALSTLGITIVYLIYDNTALTVTSSCLGVLLSLDVVSLLHYLIKRLWKIIGFRASSRERSIGDRTEDDFVVMNQQFPVLKVLFILLMLMTTAIVTYFTETKISSASKSDMIDVIGYCLIGLLVCEKMFSNLQGVYLCQILKNPLFEHPDFTSGRKSRKRNVKRVLASARKFLLNTVCPLLLVWFVALSAKEARDVSTTSFKYVMYSIAISRAFRWTWQQSRQATLDGAILMIINWTKVASSWWINLGVPTQLLLVTLLRHRVFDLLRKLWLILSLSYNFYFKKKVRHKSAKIVSVLAIVLLPIFVAILILSVGMAAPVLPLFTLPLFIMGFPRPSKFWSHADFSTKSASTDWVYYRHLTQPLLHVSKTLISSGSLGDVTAGDYFLARFQDRLIWISVLERGFMHANIVIKGLELQETSCHSLEAARIDDIYESIPDTEGKINSVLNQYPAHVLQPCDCFVLDTYSDAKNVLTGIIDQPDNLQVLSEYFLISLVWVFVRHCRERRQNGLGDGPSMLELKTEMASKEKKISVPGVNFTSSTVTDNTLEKRASQLSISSSKLSDRSSSENSSTGLWKSVNTNANNNVKVPPDDIPLVLIRDQSTLFKGSNLNVFGLPATDTGTIKSQKHERLTSTNSQNNTGGDDFDSFGFDDDFDDVPPEKDSGLGSVTDSHITKPTNMFSEIDTDKPNSVIQAQSVQKKLLKKKTLPSLTVEISSPESRQVEPPKRWKDSIPVESSDTNLLLDRFPEDWYRHTIRSLTLENKRNNEIDSILSDRGLLFTFRRLILSCYFVINKSDQTSVSRPPGPFEVNRTFNGHIQWSPYLTWLEDDVELKEQVLKAYRYAFKLMYDQSVLGEINDFDEMAEYLNDYDKNWYMGSDESSEWIEAVLNNKPNLLSIGHDSENGVYTSHVLSKQAVTVLIGQLDRENVRAFWASFALELLYFTNDDEERYSIQAHPTHLRNIIIQAADPPLGYPVYSSGLLNIGGW